MAATITEYVGKRVEVTFAEGVQEDSDNAKITGKVENANAVGFVFKPAGSSKSRLYQTSDVAEIRMAPEAEPVLRSRRLDPIALKNVKRHLVDRHGYTLTDINDMSPEAALDFHEGLGHDDLGHYHDLSKAQKEEVAEVTEAPAPADQAGAEPVDEAEQGDGEQEFVFADDSEDPDF